MPSSVMRSTASPGSCLASPRRGDDYSSQLESVTDAVTMNEALEKLAEKMSPLNRLGNPNNPPIEKVQASNVLDVASLVLYGTHAIPVRLKILLDRVLASLPHEDVKSVLGAFGWTYDDYLRGYIAQDPTGSVLDKWALVTREEELVVLQQFLRFSETRALTQQFMLADNAIQAADRDTSEDLKKLIEKSARAANMLSLHRAQLPNDLSKSSSSKRDSSNAPSASSALSSTTSSISTSSIHQSEVTNTSSDKPKHTTASVSKSSAKESKDDRSSIPSLNHSPPGQPTSSSSSQSSPLNKLQCMQPYDFRQEHSRSEERKSVNSRDDRSASLSSPPHMQLGQLPQQFSMNHGSDLSLTDDGSDDETDAAMNLTASGTEAFLAAAHNAEKQLRKSAAAAAAAASGQSNSMKRRWDPMVLSTLAANPSTGKRRVQCHVCLKTFCDKGALKIHFSAVHLREMHKCTVEGCNMMFSSRRSRNRHSANPNPKLHTPNLRRKISPHDGRTANPFPVLPPSALLALSGTSPSHLSSVLQEGFLNSKLAGLANEYTQGLLDEPLGGVPLNLLNKKNSVPEEPGSPEASTHNDSDSETLVRGEKEKEDEMFEGMNLSVKGSNDSKSNRKSTHNGGSDLKKLSQNDLPLSLVNNMNGQEKPSRKRKALKPTRIAAVEASEDELRFANSSDDDGTSDTFEVSNGLKTNGKNTDVKSEDDDDLASSNISKDGFDDLSPSPKQLKTERESSRERNANPWKFEVDTSALREKLLKEKERQERREREKMLREDMDDKNTCDSITPLDMQRVKSKNQQESEISLSATTIPSLLQNENSENPLRHLESLTMGAFTAGLLQQQQQQAAVRPGGISFHAPGLGLADGPNNNNNNNQNQSDSGRESPSNAEDAELLAGVYREAALNGLNSLDIPVDKENPRRCTVCGKVFQNHFGVKTHYQNVHLKLMHKCTVEGCNAAFPSKRSRDRHSANLNLHRKLLSTSSLPGVDRSHPPPTATPTPPFSLDKMFPYPPGQTPNPADLFSRLYDPQHLAEMYQRLPGAAEAGLLFPANMGLGAFGPHLFSQLNANVLNVDRASPTAQSGGSLHSRSPSPGHDEEVDRKASRSPTSSPQPPSSPSSANTNRPPSTTQIEPMSLTT